MRRATRIRALAAAGLLAGLAGGMAGGLWAVSGNSAPIATYEKVLLVKVVDGDTVRVNVEIAPGVWATNRRCRLVDVDVAELSTEEGRAAAARVRGFLGGKKLRLRVYGFDLYGRWLVRVEAGGRDLSQWILEQKLGVARK